MKGEVNCKHYDLINCKHYDPINGWCEKMSDPKHIEYCPKSPCNYAEPIMQPMTDNDIIKALECCMLNKKCEECPLCRTLREPCRVVLAREAFNLIKRQKAENETLKAMIEAAEDHYNPLPFKGIFDEKIAEAKAEAIKEFAERLKRHKRKLMGNDFGGAFWDQAVLVEAIDNLVKEMTEGEDEKD